MLVNSQDQGVGSEAPRVQKCGQYLHGPGSECPLKFCTLGTHLPLLVPALAWDVLF